MSKTPKQRLSDVALILANGLPGVDGASFSWVLLTAAQRLASYAIDASSGDASAAKALTQLATKVTDWRDALVKAVSE